MDLLKVLRIRINSTEAEPEEVGQGVLVCTQLRKRSHTRRSGSADSKFNTSRCLRLVGCGAILFEGFANALSKELFSSPPQSELPRCTIRGVSGDISSKIKVPKLPTTVKRRCLSGFSQHR